MTTVDVGDAFELTFATATGADVTLSWYDPDDTAVLDAVEVAESPAGSGQFPYTLLPDRAGLWKAVFTASGTATSVERYWVRAVDVLGEDRPLAVLGDVVAQYGTMTAAQQTLTNTLLRAVTRMIRARIPTVDAMISDGRLDPELVALAATNMVLRVLRNPGGLRSETVGPFSRTYDTSSAAGLLAFTIDDLALLTPSADPDAFPVQVGTVWMRPGLAPRPYGKVGRGWRR